MEEFVRIRMENSEIKVTLMEITRFLEKTNSMSEVKRYEAVLLC